MFSFGLAIGVRSNNTALMNSDIKRYLSLRDSLMQEKTKLESRLREINQALGSSPGTQQTASPAATPAARGPGRGRRGARGSISLREAVLQATANSPLTKEEILDRVKALGYRFATNNPLNSLGVILYGKNPRFKNEGGRFSPMSASSAQKSNGGQGAKSGGKKGRRQLSPEARERIAAAQRARWAKRKGK
jgi:hypothetical protein